MRRSTLELLVDPISAAPLSLEDAAEGPDGDVDHGTLRAGEHLYAVHGGIPRLVAPLDPKQTQTAESFGYKWSRRETYESPELAGRWLTEDEVRDACARFGLRIEHFDAREAGFTVRARKD